MTSSLNSMTSLLNSVHLYIHGLKVTSIKVNNKLLGNGLKNIADCIPS